MEFKAVNAFIFAGSFSIGVMKAGFKLDRVLEISDDILEKNAFYFHKNYPDIPVVLPKEWENDEYLDSLKDVDLMCCNCPCSSLSTINRNASVDGKNNVHFYRLFNMFSHVKPKVFVIENAPTLIKLGFPILKDLVQKLSDAYYVTVIHDKAGNHNVAMERMRTMVVGWRKDFFPLHPVVNPDAQSKVICINMIDSINAPDVNDNPSKKYDDLASLYKYAEPGRPFITSLCLHYLKMCNGDNDARSAEIFSKIDGTKHKHEFDMIVSKLQNGLQIWDKSPWRPKPDCCFPSFSSVQEYMHPTKDRTMNKFELKKLMNYPDEFSFEDPDNECKIPVEQAMAQGVPANFGQWIASQAKLGLEHKLKEVTAEIVFQDHIKRKMSGFTVEEFMSLSGLEIKKDAKVI